MTHADHAEALADAIDLTERRIAYYRREHAYALEQNAPVAAAEYAERIDDLTADLAYLRRKRAQTWNA
ncbi:hypothetical protein [Streptomyces alboflavus]|uniref:hypothetical protein n=1 Tax=Streptomyces alboflavus TaxID=67267 RepID=UPI00368EBBB6